MSDTHFDDFKSNLTTLEKRIAEVSVDQNEDIKVALTWIDYVLRKSATQQEEVHVLREWVPKLVRAIVGKRIDWQRVNYDNVVLFLEKLVEIIAVYMHRDYDELVDALCLLLDPTQSLFTKYCSQKTDHVNLGSHSATAGSSAAAAAISADEAFLFSIEVGAWIDFRNDFNQWEIASVDRFSEYKTEMEISTQSDKKMWLSLDRDRHRIAPFGTKSSSINGGDVAATPPASAENHAATTGAATAGAGGQSSVLDITDNVWRFELKEGDLVDAKDGTNMWYQACIMELKREEPREAFINFESAAASKAPAEVATATANNMSISMGSLDDMYDEYPGDLPPLVDAATAGVAVAANDADSTATAVAADVDVLAENRGRVLARIAFIGLTEWSDEWIDITSDKIQMLNHFSFGRRGDLPIREEVLFKVNLVPSQQGEIDKFALYREGCFVQATYIQLVNCFGAKGGFDAILSKLQQWTDYPTARSTNRTRRLLQLITLVGPMHRVLTKSFLASFGLNYVELSNAILMNMSLQDIRETPVEVLEPALNALENIAVAHYGRNKAMGRMIEPMRLEVAIANLGSPYLNRRLGGLKILSDLFRRAEAAVQHPSGLKVTRPMVNDTEQVNFKVVPILYHYSVASLSVKLDQTSVLQDIFVGSNAHESLMVRASSVLCAMAEQNVLNDALLEAMWVAGHGEQKPEALKCLSEVTAHLHPTSAKVVLRALQSLDAKSVTSSVVDLAAAFALRCRDLLMKCSIADTERMIEEYYPTSTTNSSGNISGKGVTSPLSPKRHQRDEDSPRHSAKASDETSACFISSSPHQIRSVLRAYRKTIHIMWEWTMDTSGASDAVAAAALQKIESAVDLGTSFQKADEDETLPWVMHWFRMRDLINTVVDAISKDSSATAALKVLQLCICSWPFKTPRHLQQQLAAADSSNSRNNNSRSDVSSSGVRFLPFRFPNRYALSTHLQGTLAIIERVSAAVVQLKVNFNHEVLRLAQESQTSSKKKKTSTTIAAVPATAVAAEGDLSIGRQLWDAGLTSQSALGAVVVPDATQLLLNELKVGSARIGYKEVLEKMTDFLHLFVRSTDSLEIPQQTIEDVWNAVVRHPLTNDESDVVVNFCNRIIIKAVDHNNNSSSSSSADEAAATVGSNNATPVPRRSAVSSRSTIVWVFERLLCDKSFIQAAFFSARGLACIEKWFRWLNCELGLSNNDSSPAAASSAAKRKDSFFFSRDPQSLIGLSVFPDIIVSCRSENVAAAAVKFLTTLPQNLSQWMKPSSDDAAECAATHAALVTTFRSMLLSRCMADLAAIDRTLNGTISTNTAATTSAGADASTEPTSSALLRQLLFLDGILDESTANASADDAITPHGFIGRGNPVTFRVSSTSKNIKQYAGELTMYRSQSVEDLLAAVAAQVHLSVPEIKVFRLGKEMSVATDGSKLIYQLRMLCDKENLVVVERPASKTLRIDTGVSPESDAAAVSTPTRYNSSAAATTAGVTLFPAQMSPAKSIPTAVTATTTAAAADAQLPALKLSCSLEYFELLFGLLKKSSGEACDKLWNLITRIPTFANVMQQWLSLNQRSSVEEILFSFDTSRAENLPMLLYQLQLIEVLLQPVNSAQELEKQCVHLEKTTAATVAAATAPNLDPQLLRTWADRFIQKSGFEAVCKAFDWINAVAAITLSTATSTTAAATPSKKSTTAAATAAAVVAVKSNGSAVTPHLLQLSVALASKLLRGFLVRICGFECSAQHKQAIGRALIDIKLTRALSKDSSTPYSRTLYSKFSSPITTTTAVTVPAAATVAAVAAAGDDDGDAAAAAALTAAAAPVETSTTAAAADADSHSEDQMISDILAEEWGWRIRWTNATPQHQQQQQQQLLSEIFKSVTLPHIQKSLLSMIVNARQLAEHCYFNVPPSCMDSVIKTRVAARQESLSQALDCALVTWSCCAFLDSSLLQRVPMIPDSSLTVDCKTLVKSVLLGRFDRSLLQVHPNTQHQCFGVTVANWFVQIFPAVIYWVAAANTTATTATTAATATATDVINNSNNSNNSSSSNSNGGTAAWQVLSTRMLHTLLRYRPSLRLLDAKETADAEAADRINQPLFNLATTLCDSFATTTAAAGHCSLQHHNNSNSSNSNNEAEEDAKLRLSTCREIMDELRAGRSSNSSNLIQQQQQQQQQQQPPSQQQQQQPQRGFSAVLLEGNLQLLGALLTGAEEAAISELMPPRAMQFLLRDCLGLVELHKSTESILCHENSARSHMYAVLQQLTKKNPQRAAIVYRELSAVHSSVPVPSCYEYKPEKESRSPSTGYVGLRNLGSTCYMNSLLQVLYMNSDIREFILQHLQFDEAAETTSTSATTTAITTAAANAGGVAVLPMHEEELRNNIAFQLKRIFFVLQNSRKKVYAPNEWAYAFKDETGAQPINVMQQQDAQEFFQLLCERFERCMLDLHQRRSTAATAGAAVGGKVFDVLQHAFGGRLCNQMFKSEPTATTTGPSSSSSSKRDIREHYEGFVCISLEVKGCKNLERSLEKFVAGEQISDFAWEENAPRANITKRQCIAQMSDTLVLHLKRFELNFDTFRREKVNDSFEFPLRIDMLPYTKEGLEQQQQQQQQQQQLPHPREYYEYELSGVVVHTGTSDSGHYYSYIKEDIPTGESAKWFEFNDQEVSPFSLLRLESECFGGMTTTHEYVQSTQAIYSNEIVNPKSAYMLIYSRVKRINQLPTAVTAAAIKPNVSVQQQQQQAFVSTALKEMSKLQQQVYRDNANHCISLRVMSTPHLRFFSALVEDMFQQAQQHIPHRRAVLSALHTAEFALFAAKFLSRSFAAAVFSSASQNLKKYLDAYQIEFQKLQNSAAAASNSSTAAIATAAAARVVTAAVPPLPPNATTAAALLPPPPSYDEAAAASSDQLAGSAAPFPHFGLPHSDALLLPQQQQQQQWNGGSTIAVHEVVLAELLLQFDAAVMDNLFASTDVVRKQSAALLLQILQMNFAHHGRVAFKPSVQVDPIKGLLSVSFMTEGGTTARPSNNNTATTAVVGQHSSVTAVTATATAANVVPMVAVPAADVIDLTEGEEMDEDLLLAIKMSQAGADGLLPSAVTAISAEPIEVLAVDSTAAATTVSPPSLPSSAAATTATTATAAVSAAMEGAADILRAAQQRGVFAISTSTLAMQADERLYLLPNFLVELTSNSRMALIGENWRKVQWFLWLLLETARIDSELRLFMLRREVTAQLVDTLLGEQSPLNGQLYKKGARRHAPSSYVAVGVTRDGSMPYAAKNLPDWSHLVELLSLLVCSSDSLNMVASMGDVSHQCLMNKSLFSTLFRQARYMPATIPMMMHLLFENRFFSDLIAEALFEEFSLCAAECTAHVFSALEKYLSISDSLRFHRCTLVLGTGAFNVLEVMKAACLQQQKERLVCIFIRSFCALLLNLPELQQTMANTAPIWAPWMLKFCYQYKSMCSIVEASAAGADAAVDSGSSSQPLIGPLPSAALMNEVKASNGSATDARKTLQSHNSNSSSSNTTTPVSKQLGVTFQDQVASAAAARKGPFTVVFGEDDSERELPWHTRAERTNQLLYDLLLRMGKSPEVLIPADTFTVQTPPPPLMSVAAVGGSSGNGNDIGVAMQLADGMSDEELALLLQQETLNNDID